MNIIVSDRFDITVSESQDYRGQNRYVVRYGLHVRKCDTLPAAVKEFRDCLSHALECNGVFDDAEE